MLYQLNYCYIVYPKSTSISDILPLTFIQRPRCIRNSVGGVRKPYWLRETVTIRPASAYEADDEPLLYPRHIGVRYRNRTYDLAVMEMIIGIAPKLSNFAIITAARSNLLS